MSLDRAVHGALQRLHVWNVVDVDASSASKGANSRSISLAMPGLNSILGGPGGGSGSRRRIGATRPSCQTRPVPACPGRLPARAPWHPARPDGAGDVGRAKRPTSATTASQLASTVCRPGRYSRIVYRLVRSTRILIGPSARLLR